MNENDKLREAILAYQGVLAEHSRLVRLCKNIGVTLRRVEAELARVIHATGGRAIISDGKRFSTERLQGGPDDSPSFRLSVVECDDRILNSTAAFRAKR